MPAAFAALHRDHVDAELHHLLRMFDRADGRHAEDAGVLEAADHLRIGAAPEADRTHLIAVLQDDLDDLRRAGLKHVEIDAEGLLGARLDREDRGLELGGLHHRAREEAKRARLARRDHQPRRRDPAHCGLDYG